MAAAKKKRRKEAYFALR